MKPNTQNSQVTSLQNVRVRINSLNMPQPVVIGLVVGLLAIGSFCIYRFLSPEAPPARSTAAQANNPDMDWLYSKAKQTGGDYNGLSEADRARANEIAQKNTGTSAKTIFSMMAPAVEQETANAAKSAARNGQ